MSNIYSDSIDYFVSIMRRVDAERKDKIQKGAFVNIFTLWNCFSGITEPIHSRILHFLLSSNPMHGQGTLFLGLFLKRLGIDIKPEEEWIVTAETGRVDIMLKRFFPDYSVVIIENKSNWAGDQPNQLYRYWFDNIHRCEIDFYREFYDNHNEYKIVYLVPNDNKSFSDNSLKRPDDYPKELPSVLPMDPIKYTFDKDIVDWLEDCISQLPKDNTPLINLLSQYKEYCRNL